MHKLFCCVTFVFRVVIESSSNEYTILSFSCLGCKHFWEGERETLEKLGSALSCYLSVTWNSVTCDIKKGHFDNLTTRMWGYFSLFLANEWQITKCLQLTIKIFSSFFCLLWSFMTSRSLKTLQSFSSFSPVFSFLPCRILLVEMKLIFFILRGLINVLKLPYSFLLHWIEKDAKPF